jgi:hypothetical protein
MKEGAVLVVGLAIVALLAVIVYQSHRRFHKPLLTTPYQAVVLQNGAVFYGRLDHLGTDHPVLRDALTIRHEVDQATGEARYVVVRRKDEAGGADHMIFPVTAIAFVEPVHPGSTIGKLVEEAIARR